MISGTLRHPHSVILIPLPPCESQWDSLTSWERCVDKQSYTDEQAFIDTPDCEAFFNVSRLWEMFEDAHGSDLTLGNKEVTRG